MGGGEIDDLEKVGHKLQTVFGDMKKLFVFGNLIHNMLSEGDGLGKIKNRPPATTVSVFQAQQLPLLQP